MAARGQALLTIGLIIVVATLWAPQRFAGIHYTLLHFDLNQKAEIQMYTAHNYSDSEAAINC